MNYLVLTPDGVGSTYLQRALTLFLNSSNIEYFNTHELLNGLALDKNNNLYKSPQGYDQSLEEIVELLKNNQANIVSRLAEYHVEKRSQGIIGGPGKPPSPEIIERNAKEDYTFLYDACNNKFFDKILYCTRNPFEYALSWSIRKFTGKLNVYSIVERLSVHRDSTTYDVDVDFMTNKLNQYQRYIYWVRDNFPYAQEVNYEDIHSNIDKVLAKITGSKFSMKDKWKITLQEHSVMLYKFSKMYNDFFKNYQIETFFDYSDRLIDYQKKLATERKLVQGVPIKMTTLEEKKNRITNFSQCVDTYNEWAGKTNEFTSVSQNIIDEKISKEQKIYLLGE